MAVAVAGSKRELDKVEFVEERTGKLPRPSVDEQQKGKEELSEDVVFLFEELELHDEHKPLMIELGITTILEILGRRDDFKDEKVGGIRGSVQESLYHFCLWHEDFLSKNDPGTFWRDNFTIKSFDHFVKEMKSKRDAITPIGTAAADALTLPDEATELQLRSLFDKAVSVVHEKHPGHQLASLPTDGHGRLYDYVVNLTMEQLPKTLVKNCQFDVKALIKTCTKAIFNLPSGKPYPKIQLVAGRTQCGKSNVKAVIQAVCRLLKCPTLIITKGVAESKDLAKKLNDLMDLDKDSFDIWWSQSNKNNKPNVFPDTAAGIKRAMALVTGGLRKRKPCGKFCVIVDECDAMYRTEEKAQQMERAYYKLMDLQPALRIEISATPIPALLVLGSEGHQVEMLELGTSDDYCGVTEMVSLQDNNSEDLFLEKLKFDIGFQYSKINARNLQRCDNTLVFPEEEDLSDKQRPLESETRIFQFNQQKLKFIPCTDDSVMSLYDNALQDAEEEGPKKQGVLLLDCTISRVQAEQNIFQKASLVQNHYHSKGKEIVIIIVVGSGIYVRRPGFLYGRKILNRKTVSDVIERLDQEFGLEMPFFVFGYSKMKRCISYRSDRRVPTHMVLYLGLGQSNESFIQAIGRATFNGLETVLAKNGFKHVTVLTPENDFLMARKYTHFVHEISERLKAKNATIEEILNDGKEKFKDESNFLLHTNRKTGQIKTLKNRLPKQDQFETPKFVSNHSCKKGTLKNKVLRAVYDLVHESQNNDISGGNDDEDNIDNSESSENSGSQEESNFRLIEANERGFTVKDIQGKYNDTHQENGHTIKRAELNKTLTELKNLGKLEKTDDSRDACWRAKNWLALKLECGLA